MEPPAFVKAMGRGLLPRTWQRLPLRLNENSKAIQMLAAFVARQQYPSIADCQDGRPGINGFEFKVYSQNGEDGIILQIFSRVGVTNRRFVEFGVGDGRECNTANLAIHFGWHGLLMEANEGDVATAKRYYRARLGPSASAVKIVQSWVTAENINETIPKNGMEGEIDLLSVDIDGNDYWVWKAIDCIGPRVAVIEYNASLGHEPITVAYDPNFDRYEKHPSGFYHGASLAALDKLAKTKGYVLVGCDSAGVNAFFVRREVAQDSPPPVSPEKAYFPHSKRVQTRSTDEQLDLIKHLAFDRV